MAVRNGPPFDGTVARGHLHTDVALFHRQASGQRRPAAGQWRRRRSSSRSPARRRPRKLAKAQYDQFVDTFPFPMTEAVLEHGYHRFMIYCVVCHDPLGTGQGKIVQRGYTAPPSYHIERLRKAPVGHLFAVISEGYGSMPSYGAQIPVRDRWAIVGYLRALQASQHFPEAKLTDEMRRRAVRSRTRPPRQEEQRREQQCFSRSRRSAARWQRSVALGGVRRPDASAPSARPFSPVPFFRAYLAAYLFYLGIALGSMVLLMVYHLTGGSWGFLIRRILEAGMRTLPLLAVLFLPIACGIRYLYLWAQPEVVAASPQLQYQQFYLAPTCFWIRAAVYFAVWLAMAFLLASWSRKEDETGNPRLAWKSQQLGAFGAVVYGISLHFAAIDWGMSLQPVFHSTIWGPLFATGQLLSALAFALVVLALAGQPAAAGRGRFRRRSATIWQVSC